MTLVKARIATRAKSNFIDYIFMRFLLLYGIIGQENVLGGGKKEPSTKKIASGSDLVKY
jgi:hypothetical protein